MSSSTTTTDKQTSYANINQQSELVHPCGSSSNLTTNLPSPFRSTASLAWPRIVDSVVTGALATNSAFRSPTDALPPPPPLSQDAAAVTSSSFDLPLPSPPPPSSFRVPYSHYVNKVGDLCQVCGRLHDPALPHLYAYVNPVDPVLLCQLCRQPLIDPLDTRCGHTFCSACLKNHLAVQALCPQDRQIINYLECQQSSNLVKQLLDKLVVACPNTQHCSQHIARSSLESHLTYQCRRGTNNIPPAPMPVRTAFVGAPQAASNRLGSPVAMRSAFVPLPYSPVQSKACLHSSPPQASLSSPRSSHSAFVGFTKPPSSTTSPFAAAGRPTNLQTVIPLTSSAIAASNWSTGPPCATGPPPNRLPSNRPPPPPQSFGPSHRVAASSAVTSAPATGQIGTVRLTALDGHTELGISIVGGSDTPLLCVIIQEIYLDGIVAQDGRIRPGDQILDVNGIELANCSHDQACRLLALRGRRSESNRRLALTIYREHPIEAAKSVSSRSPFGTAHRVLDRLEIIHVTLPKLQEKRLGIKLAGKKNCLGLYVLGLIEGGQAELDGRIRKDDRILEINGTDLSNGTQEQAAKLINNTGDHVSILFARLNRSATPDIIRTASGENVALSASGPRPVVTVANNRSVGGGSSSSSSVRQSPSSLAEDDDDDECSCCLTVTDADSTTNVPLLGRKCRCRRRQHRNDAGGNQPPQLDSPCTTVSSVCSISQPREPPPATCSTPPPQCVRVCQEEIVKLTKQSGESLGMVVAGGVGSQRGDVPVYVTNLDPQGLVARSGQVKRGHVLLAVNDTELLGLSHERAVDALTKARDNCTDVVLRLLKGPVDSNGGYAEDGDNSDSNKVTINKSAFVPSWLFWLQLPRYCQLPRLINLVRDPHLGLGFSIIGGNDFCPDVEDMHIDERRRQSPDDLPDPPRVSTPRPIVVKSVVVGSPCYRDGRLKCGDILLSVDNHSLTDVSHSYAVSLLKNCSGEVRLCIVSWPGTIV